MRWEDETLAYWFVWKPLAFPGVIAWCWTGGRVGISPTQYVQHAVEATDRARADFTARNPGHPLARRGPGMARLDATPTVTYLVAHSDGDVVAQ